MFPPVNRPTGVLRFITALKFTILLLLMAPMAHAQQPAWSWAKKSTGTGDDQSRGIAVDRQGNTYITGIFDSPSIAFSPYTFQNAGNRDVFVVKYNPAGGLVWARKAGSMYDEFAWGIAVDSSGNCYVTGHFNISITFGAVTLTGGSNTLFVVKYDAAGNVVWARQAGPTATGSATPRGIAADAAGNCYITGFCSNDPMTFGNIILNGNSVGGDDLFVVKYNTDGDVVWAKRPSGTGSDHGLAIAVDPSGNAYVTGFFESATLNFGSVQLSYPLSANRYFTVKYDVAGNALWARSGEGIDVQGMAIAADSLGNSYVTGRFYGQVATFDTVQLQNGGQGDLFLIKYTPAGKLAWAKNWGGTSEDVGLGVGVDAKGKCYVAGQFFGQGGTFGSITLPDGGSSNAFVLQVDDTGAIAWAQSVDGNAAKLVDGLAVDADGNCYLTGHFGGLNSAITFGSTTFQTGTGMNVFTAKLSNGSPAPFAVPLTLNNDVLKVYPNPVARNARIVCNTDHEGSLILTDCLGRTIRNTTKAQGVREMDLDLSLLPAGVYLMSFQSSNTTQTIRLTKE